MVAIPSLLCLAALSFLPGISANAVGIVKRANERKETPTLTTKQIGDSRGSFFTDYGVVTKGHSRIKEMRLFGCETNQHLSQIQLVYESRSGTNQETTVTHGHLADTDSEIVLKLEEWDHIQEIEVATYFAGKGRKDKRIGAIRLKTNDAETTCGNWYNDETVTWSFPGHAFLFFAGYGDNVGINALTAKFLPVANY